MNIKSSGKHIVGNLWISHRAARIQCQESFFTSRGRGYKFRCLSLPHLMENIWAWNIFSRIPSRDKEICWCFQNIARHNKNWLFENLQTYPNLEFFNNPKFGNSTLLLKRVPLVIYTFAQHWSLLEIKLICLFFDHGFSRGLKSQYSTRTRGYSGFGFHVKNYYRIIWNLLCSQ